MASVAHLRGRIAGAVIMTFFGSAWCILALVFWPARPPWSIPAACIATAALLTSCVLRFVALRSIPSLDDPIAAEKGKRAGIFFGIIFTFEGLFIGLCSTFLAHVGLSAWIPIATALIVGLHFIPLARVFEVPLYYWTGTLIVLAMLFCALIHNPDVRTLCACLTMAAVLWLTALWLLRHTSPAQLA